MKVYCASKSKYGPLWKEWEDNGVQVTSSWLEKFDQGRLPDQTEHWDQILEDIQGSDALLLYSEEGDVQKGALAEFGIAFALGKKLFYVGPTEGSLTAVEHKNVQHYPDLKTFFSEVCGIAQ
ncbi:hypothetical protein H6784_05390 [Candidatus Nomurabacteria bacterium]|nr:hypothetical protein [Candidatus Kaiserbacteria bacterium]MCB9814813.1 hypothetical protein [Candidatus Nomurabacteria bacterium]